MKNFHNLPGLIILVLCDMFIITNTGAQILPGGILLWKEGISWVQMVVGIGFPVDLKEETITIGPALKAYYKLPTNTSDLTHSASDISRKGRSILRQRIYSAIETILQRYEYSDGKSCLLKAICEYSQYSVRNHSLISRVLDVILRPSSTTDEMKENDYASAEYVGKADFKCDYLFPECGRNMLFIP